MRNFKTTWLGRLLSRLMSDLVFYGQVYHRNGLVGLWTAYRLAIASHKLQRVYVLIEREEELHEENLRQLRLELRERQVQFSEAHRAHSGLPAPESLPWP